MDKLLKSKLNHLIMLYPEEADIITETINYIKSIEGSLKDSEEMIESLQDKMIRKSVRKYNDNT